MIRFALGRKVFTIFCAVTIAAGNMAFVTREASYASDWADLLKPLVKDVIVPGASMGMKKLIERNKKNNPEQSQDASQESQDMSNTDGTNWSEGDTAGTENGDSWQDSFSTPDGPTTSSNEDDSIEPTPDGPISSASTGDNSSPMDPPPPPPPPVATP